jgi:hypothetical protein
LVPGQRDETGTKGYYNPIIFPNEFWHLRSQYIEINDTTPSVPLQVVFQPMSYFKFQVFASMTFSFQEAIKQQGGGSAAEFDEVKRMLVETNPWFLGLTGVVSVLHVVSVGQAFVLRTLLPYTALGLKCWHSSQMSLIGERKMNLLAFPSGMRFLTWVLLRFIDINFTNQRRTVCFHPLCGPLRVPKFLHLADHHECLRAASDLTISY